jgi:GNAT superfamily N-acetyltransferase
MSVTKFQPPEFSNWLLRYAISDALDEEWYTKVISHWKDLTTGVLEAHVLPGGFCLIQSFKGEPIPIIFIHLVFVVPAQRRQGVASRLLTALSNEARIIARTRCEIEALWLRAGFILDFSRGEVMAIRNPDMDELSALRAEDDAFSGRKRGQLPIALPTCAKLIDVFHEFMDGKILLTNCMLNFLFDLTVDEMRTYLASLENWDRLWAYAIVRAQQLQNVRDKCRLQSGGGALNLHEQVEHYGQLVPRMEAIADVLQMTVRCAEAGIAIFGEDSRKEVSGLEASLRRKFDTATHTEHMLQ